MKKLIFLLLPIFLCATVNEQHLRSAFEIATESRQQDSHPFGAVLIYENQLFLTGLNKVGPLNNPLKHAEIVLLENYLNYRDASPEERKKIAPQLKGELPSLQKCQMYTSTQPCQMCEGAIYTMKVGRMLSDRPQIIFGLDKDSLSEVVRGYTKHDRSVTISGPHLVEDAKKVHEGFWR